MAEQFLGPADWADLDRAAVSLPGDPLFDRPTDREFLALLNDIKAWEVSDQSVPGPDRPEGKRSS